MESKNSYEELKKQVVYVIGEERMNGRIEELSAEYICKVLGAELKDVQKILEELR